MQLTDRSKPILVNLVAWLCITHFFAVSPGYAAESDNYSELAVHTGHGSLFDPQPDYAYTEITYTHGQSIDAWLAKRLRFNLPGDWDFRISPALALLHDPGPGLEISCAVGLSVSTTIQEHWKPYIFCATGPLYTSAKTTEQATRFNFGSYAGYGIEYRLDEKQGVCIYTLVRHFSNGGIKDPNDGIDTSSWGISYIWYR